MASRAELAALAPDPELARRIAADPGLGPYLREIEEEAEAARGRRFPSLPFSAYRLFDERGERRGFEDFYFERRRALVALALASWLWRRAEDIAALEDLVWAICDEYSWTLPAHLGGTSLDPGRLLVGAHSRTLDLFACETGFALAEIAAMLGELLNPMVAGRARAEIERRVLAPFPARSGSWPWERMKNNWCAVCAGSIGSAALYLVDDPNRLDAILSRLYPTLERFLESFSNDGACLEGLGYWTYGLGFYVSFAELLGRATGGAVDLLAGDKLPRIAAFQSKAYLTSSIAVGFADGSAEERYRIGLSSFLERRFPDAAMPAPSLAAGFRHDHYGRFCLSLRDLIWSLEPGGKGASREGSRPSVSSLAPSYFPDAQWLLCPAPDDSSLAFAAKGGSNDEPHNHDDVGSFELILGGTQFLAELGAGEYTKDYFGERRYEIFCNSSLGHSLPIIDGRGQEEGAERRAKNVECRIEGRRVGLSMDIGPAYACPGLSRLARSFDFDGSGLLVLEDEFELAGRGHRIVERFVTGLGADAFRVERGGGSLEAAGGRLRIVSSLADAIPRIVLVPHIAHDGRRVEVACLDFELQPDGDFLRARFEFSLVPL